MRLLAIRSAVAAATCRCNETLIMILHRVCELGLGLGRCGWKQNVGSVEGQVGLLWNF